MIGYQVSVFLLATVINYTISPLFALLSWPKPWGAQAHVHFALKEPFENVSCLLGKLAARCGFLFTFFPGALKKKPVPDMRTCLYLLCWGSCSVCSVWRRGARSSSRCDALSPQPQDTWVGSVPPNLSAALRWGQGHVELPELFSSGKRRRRVRGQAGCVLRVGGLLCHPHLCPRTS